MSSTKILLTGATGYIGGTILHQLLEAKYGDRVECIPFSGLDDLALLTETAGKHDIIINAASGFHAASAEAMIKGLALRKESLAAASQTTDEAWMLHTSGCSNISDKPKAEDARSPYPQRTSELRALEAGEALGIPVLSVQSPIIFGTGEGLLQDAAVIVPIMMRYVLDHGHGFVAGDGTGTFDIVHISGVGSVYTLLVRRIIEGRAADLPRGRERVHDVAMRCLEAASLMAGNYTVAEAAWASHLQQKGTVARDLGWVPTFGQEAWEQEFKLELQAALDGKRAMTIENTLNGEK
ncbi:NAD dependent epimerase/dehydratase [Trichoderma pleuroticola]